MIETSTLTASDDFMFDDRIRDVPPGTAAFPASAGASRNWRPIDGVMALPALTLHETVFTSNRDLVLRDIRARGAEIAPHAKTPMSLDLARSLIDAGAWGATVADVSSARQAFRPASRVWAEILSRPEPICSMDVRDVSFDQGLPVVLGGHPNSDTVARKPRARVVKLNDQRAFVTREPDADFRSGDVVEFGVSHPCTFFDRYRVIFSLDESGRVRRAYPTTSVKSTNCLTPQRRELAMMKHYKVSPRMAQAVTHNGVVHIAGQVADNRKAGIEDQTRDVLAKIDALLAEAGTSKSKLVAVNIFLPHITDFEAMNHVYDAWVDPDKPPARACVEARLADPDLRIEMTVIAAL